MVRLSIIIPTFNRNESANACIRSILRSGVEDLEIIVVNDHKQKAFILEENNTSPFVKVLNNPQSGVAAARNYGAAHAAAPRLLFIDDDMIVNGHAILKAIGFLDANGHCTYNADWSYEKTLLEEIEKTSFGRYLIRHHFTSLKGWNHNSIRWKENTLLQAKGITSQFLAIRKTDFELLGGYNEQFPMAGFEDYEFHTRMIKQCFSSYIDTSVMIYHNERDRVLPASWLDRKKRGAQTRRVAVELGFSELKINYSFIHKTAYRLLVPVKPVLMKLLNAIPARSFFDPFYFRLVNILLGVHMFEGYRMMPQQHKGI